MNASTATHTAFAEALRPLVPSRRELLADAWRENKRSVEDSLRFLKQYRRILDEADAMLLPGVPVHSAERVRQTRKAMPWRLTKYLEALKGVSLAEVDLDALGIEYSRSSDDWREDDGLKAAVWAEAMGAV